MTVYKSIGESLVWDSDLGDLLDQGGFDLNIEINTESQVRQNIKEIRAALESDGDTYEMSDEAMIIEIMEIMNRLNIEAENEETGTTLYQRVVAQYLDCDPEDVEEQDYDHFGLKVFSDGDNEVAIGTETEVDSAIHECIEQEAWSFNSDFIAKHSKNGYSTELDKAIKMVQEEMSEDAQDLVIAVIENLDTFIEDAVTIDGRGMFLNRNDNTEDEVKYKGVTYYLYKI
jgi:hypothetical protein